MTQNLDKQKFVQTVGDPEFINIQSISPQISKCQVKVAYVGKNRNGSFISKNTLTDMAGTLRGVPIIGQYIENKEDFGDHGEQMIIDGEGVKFNKLTRPYGFVSLDSKIWFQTFVDMDDFGNEVNHEYLMCEGYLWTELYQECKKALDICGQSMELNPNTMQGYWSEDSKSGMNFYIITDATFNALCILGDDVEPCFEGAAVSETFSKNDEFFNQLYSMKKELFQINKNEEGDNKVEKQLQELQDKYSALEADFQSVTNELNTTKESLEESNTKFNSLSTEKETLEQEIATLKESVATYEAQIQELTNEKAELENYKLAEENKKKDALIESFSMLTQEDKQDCITNKEKYSLEDIEAKLSTICFRKNLFGSNNAETEQEKTDTLPGATFNLQNGGNSNQSDFIAEALEANRNRK